MSTKTPPAAIANALADAVGVRLTEMPLTAEKLYHALKEKDRPRQAQDNAHAS